MQGSLTGVLASRNKSTTFTGTSVLVPLQYYGDATTFYRNFVNEVPLTAVGDSTTLFSAQVNTVPLTSA